MVSASRGFGFIVLLLVYAAAGLLGVIVFGLAEGWGFFLRLFAADAAATLFVWLTGLILKNASVYDPYWSVAPIVMLSLGALHLGALSSGALLLGAAVALWGIRLTAHWSTTFAGLHVQDWRYTMLKESRPRLWFLVNLFGINLFPTVVVFMALAPAFQLLMNFREINPGFILGLAVCLSAVALQQTADAQLQRFRKRPESGGHVIRAGVWRYSRHPNYLGEILMWWGVCLAALSAPGASALYAIGPLVNTLMFIFISIPLMERRQLRSKAEYAAYKAETGMLLPRLRRRRDTAAPPPG